MFGLASLGSDVVFGVQLAFRVDCTSPFSSVGGFLELLRGTADQVGNTVDAGEPKSEA